MDNDTPRHSREDVPSGNMPDAFDRMLGNLHGLPDSVRTKPTTLRSVEPIVGHSQTHIVQTIRLREVTEKSNGTESVRGRDWLFTEAIDRGQVIRMRSPRHRAARGAHMSRKQRATDAVVRAFIEAVCPEAPELYMASFDEATCLQDATELIRELQQRDRGWLAALAAERPTCSGHEERDAERVVALADALIAALEAEVTR